MFKSDYINGPKRLEGVITFFAGNGSISKFEDLKFLKVLKFFLFWHFTFILTKKRDKTPVEFLS